MQVEANLPGTSAVCTFVYSQRIKKMFDIENEGQGHGVQHSQWFHSIANINLYKRHTRAFFASSHRFWDIYISKLWPWKCRTKSWSTTFAVATLDGKFQISYLMAIVMFPFSNAYLSKTTWKVWHRKLRCRSWNTTFAVVTFYGEYQSA